jgi:hypothetical protein
MPIINPYSEPEGSKSEGFLQFHVTVFLEILKVSLEIDKSGTL